MQDNLFPEEDRQKYCDRLFLAVLPDIATAIHINQAARQFLRDHRINAVPMAVKRQHISLQHLGDYPQLPGSAVCAARQAAGSFFMPAFEIVLDAIGSFSGVARADTVPHWPLVLHADGDGLFDLFDRLGRALRENGLPANKRLLPHLTLCYGPQAIPFQVIGPIRFIAKELVLIHSEVGLTRYHILGRWPFRNPPSQNPLFDARRRPDGVPYHAV